MSSRIISLPRILDDRGNLSFLENGHQIPFEIKRVHWIYDVPGGESRGALAYKQTEEFIVAMSGSFDVWVDDGKTCEKYHLNRSYEGVYVPRGTWRKIDNFSTNSLAAIATSTLYDEHDAIRDYDDFLAWTKMQVQNPGGLSQEKSAEAATKVQSPAEIPAFSVHDCQIIHLDRHHSARKGDICVVENGLTVPFDIKRMYYLYDVPADAVRGGHAHKNLYQLLVAAAGSFRVNLDDGQEKKSIYLNRPYQALLIKPGIWREVDDFSSGSVCMVLASELYDESDYIRRYQDFQAFTHQSL